MADDRDEGTLEGLFGGPRSDEERANDERKWDRESNERARIAFEKEKERRADYVAMDQRIRNIVSQEINKVFWVAAFLGAIWWTNDRYGSAPAVGVFVIGMAIWLWEGRKADQLPRKGIEEVDDLAEDTVSHRRIVAFEEAGRPWVTVKGKYLHYEEFNDHPFWDEVNKQVREYVRMSPKSRKSHNRAARDASLPYRLAMQSKLDTAGGEHGEEWSLPYFARFDARERRS
ncbi:hypothetical protein N6H05_23810 [Sphingobium sp. WTD-1]|uniref:hypothetical protein n=1 Tax=Sphingobium sp. WTD-1 TaxID=2979467 RepID=UPI0024DE6FDA|nr:hypothetical protein [Sphingobium sp. WTD-1]WIA56006.1 hypothetical protein N6H05_23810 [Sphingobium sp. WTD-1]